MNSEIKQKIISIIEEAINYEYPLRWVDEKTTSGDFDGRAQAIDVFQIPFSEQLLFLEKVETTKKSLDGLIKNRCLFIFHSPEMTKKHYSHLFPVTKNILFEGMIKLPTPGVSGTECKPEFSDLSIAIFIPITKVAA